MSLTGTRGASALRSFPRVSGDEPMQQRELTLDTLFSPRERG